MHALRVSQRVTGRRVRHLRDKPKVLAMTLSPYRPRRLTLANGREVTLRAIRASDDAAIAKAFERLSDDSRYARFMHHKKELDVAALRRGVRPQPGSAFAFVATVPAADGFDIVGAAQYVPSSEGDTEACEFAISVLDDWHGTGLATELLASLVRRARRDGYQAMLGSVMAGNDAMLRLARHLKFSVEPVPDEEGVVRVRRALRRR